MNSTKIVSRILFYITRFLSIFYFATALLAIVALISGWGLGFKESGKYFHVYYPFTTTPFINGDYNTNYIIFDFLLPLTLYGLFFLLVSNVFKVFFQPKLFTAYNIKHLKRFYLVNILAPGLIILFRSFFTEWEEMAGILIVLHFILGIFTYFLAAIFKQGLNLQKEQDLII